MYVSSRQDETRKEKLPMRSIGQDITVDELVYCVYRPWLFHVLITSQYIFGGKPVVGETHISDKLLVLTWLVAPLRCNQPSTT